MKLNKLNLIKRFKKADVSKIEDLELRQKALLLKRKQGGFTLLELLIVVAILAAIAGTATVALQDTDARAAAAAHVAMMDELNKGIRTFRTLNGNEYPTAMDSLVQVDDVSLANPALLEIAAIDDLVLDTITMDQFSRLADVGITGLNYVAHDQDPEGDGDCTAGNIEGLISSRQNAVVSGNIYLSANGNGCGVRAQFTDDADGNGTADDPGYSVFSQAAGGTLTESATATTDITIAVWNGGAERLTGQAEAGAFNAEGNTVFMATGLGPASNLFNANEIGGLSSVPVYRHVSETEYNRFIAIWDIGNYDAAGEIVETDQPSITTVIDGAGDTKEEELGEWDGTRNTI